MGFRNVGQDSLRRRNGIQLDWSPRRRTLQSRVGFQPDLLSAAFRRSEEPPVKILLAFERSSIHFMPRRIGLNRRAERRGCIGFMLENTGGSKGDEGGAPAGGLGFR